MRAWVTASLLLCVGGLLLWLAGRQFADGWPQTIRAVHGRVVNAETGMVAGFAGRELRLAITLDHPARARFELASALLPRPTAGALSDAAQVAIDYDARVRLRANPRRDLAACPLGPDADPMARARHPLCAQYQVYYVVTGLAADGRVYFTPFAYKSVVALWTLVLLVPGLALFGVGALSLRRLLIGRAGARDIGVVAAAARDPRKTADGHWIH